LIPLWEELNRDEDPASSLKVAQGSKTNYTIAGKKLMRVKGYAATGQVLLPVNN